MGNQLQVNRIERELDKWPSKEAHFSKLFTSFDISSNKAWLGEKLKFYESILSKYKRNASPEERLTIKIIGQEKNLLEKQVYPDVLGRLMRRIYLHLVKKPIDLRRSNRQIEQNNMALQEKLERIGFKRLFFNLGENIKQSHEHFSLPVSYYLNEKERMEFQLSFFKDYSGQYQFDGYKAALHNTTMPDQDRSHYFRSERGYHVDATESYNLLSGRAIFKDTAWIQFDLNDKGVNNNYRLKEFPQAYGYDLDKILSGLPLKADTETLSPNLKKGNREEISFFRDGNEHRYHIEANPQFKTVNVYDNRFKKISIALALGSEMTQINELRNNVKNVQGENKPKKNSRGIK